MMENIPDLSLLPKNQVGGQKYFVFEHCQNFAAMLAVDFRLVPLYCDLLALFALLDFQANKPKVK